MADYKAIADQLRSQLGRNPTGTEILAVARAPSSSSPPISVSRPTGTPPAPVGGMLTSGQTTRTVDRNSITLPTLSSVTETSRPPISGQSSLSRDQLNQIYLQELGRPLGTEGEQYWLGGGTTLTDPNQIVDAIRQSSDAQQYRQSRPPSGMLTSGNAPLSVDRNSLNLPALSSVTENVNNTGLLSNLLSTYETELGRRPEEDYEGLNYWLNQVNTGQLTLDQAREAIATSPEAVVYDAYTGLLGRAPDTEGSQYFQQQLQSGALTPEQLEIALLQSEEAMSRTFDSPVTQTVADLFEDILGRAPRQEGLQFWEEEFNRAFEQTGDVTTALQSIAGGIQSSPEFLDNSVGSLYSTIFGRPADEETRSMLTEQAQTLVDSGLPLNEALQGVGQVMQANKRTEDLLGSIQSEDPYESMRGLRDLFYSVRSTGQTLGANTIEELLGPQDEATRGQNTLTDPYTRSFVAYVNAEGLARLNEAIEAGDTETATRLARELEDPFIFYENNINNRSPGTLAGQIRQNIVGEDLFYGTRHPRRRGILRPISDFVSSVKSFFDDPIEALDRWKDKPLNQFIVSAINPAAGAVLSAYSTIDQGGKLSPMQIIALAANAPGIGNLTQQGATAIGIGDLGITDSAVLQSVADGAQLVEQAASIITAPVAFVANNVIDNLGGKDALIAAAGEEAAGRIEEGIRSGATAALIAEATGGNPAIAFVKELKGEIPIDGLIPDVPQSVKDFVAGIGDAISDIPLPDLQFVEDWVRDNITLQVNTDFFDSLRNLGFTDKLASIEDWIKDNVDLSGIEDFLKDSGEVIGDTVKQIVEAVPDIDLPSLDLPDINIGGVVPMEELAGPARSPRKGTQGLLPVDTTFYYEEPSLAEQILAGETA